MPDLGAFAGTWAIDRRIEDARAGAVLRFAGRAVLRPDGHGLIYEESGTLEVPGQAPMVATRRYLWRQGAEGIEIYFADGRFFHAIAPGPRPGARHDCPPDTYDVAYDFSAWPIWGVVWQVTGPRKSYGMTTRHTPLGACTGRGAGAKDAKRFQRE